MYNKGILLALFYFALLFVIFAYNLKAELCIFYLDDATVGGTTADLIHVLDTVRRLAEDIGLHLNTSKSELICNSTHAKDSVLAVAPEI